MAARLAAWGGEPAAPALPSAPLAARPPSPPREAAASASAPPRHIWSSQSRATQADGQASCPVHERGPRSPAAVGKSLQRVVQGGLGALYLHLLSLRVGLLGWYFCLKQIQWDLLHWIHSSLELAIDFCFFWAQNVLLACMMGLLLAWKVHNGAKKQGWAALLRGLALEAQLARGLSLLKRCFWNLGRLVTHVTWLPACGFTWMIFCVSRTLAISYKHASRMAQDEDEADGEGET
ncbi:uncharacterized protein LOC134412799 [Elgaria multicarinata webbii]|uniref:uncharacterized protein LOC134412799 n=1 Tax=Elgaria multicarinata webbii TaxID=159646 RepID=UPI002FCD1F75